MVKPFHLFFLLLALATNAMIIKIVMVIDIISPLPAVPPIIAEKLLV